MRSFVIAAALLLVAQPAFAQTGGWLAKPLSPWNLAGAAVPKAPKPKGDSPSDPRCAGGVRHPETAVEGAVTTAGWSLFSTPRVKGDTTVLLAEASVDGMCRPWDYQAFVFVKRRFAGTLSPGMRTARKSWRCGGGTTVVAVVCALSLLEQAETRERRRALTISS